VKFVNISTDVSLQFSNCDDGVCTWCASVQRVAVEKVSSLVLCQAHSAKRYAHSSQMCLNQMHLPRLEHCWRYYVFGLSLCVSIRSCVHLESMWTRCLINCLGEFHQIYKFDAPAGKDELIRFWCQKVKCQGHRETNHGQKYTLAAILSPQNTKWW